MERRFACLLAFFVRAIISKRLNSIILTFASTQATPVSGKMLARQLRSKGSITATLRRTFASTAQRNSPVATESAVTPPPSESSSSPNSYYKITLLRSAIALGARKKATLVSLGIHRRMQTVYHPHSPEFAGKILAVKELVRVENVPKDAVRTKTEQRQERKASRGYVILDRLQNKDLFADVSK